MSHKYTLGKVDYCGDGEKSCEADLEWELESGRFAMSAAIWNSRHTDILCGGQCVDEVAGYFPDNEKAQRMLKVWQRWHLNDMHAECEHQRILGWTWRTHPSEACPTCGYKLGSAWLKEELPQDVISEIESW